MRPGARYLPTLALGRRRGPPVGEGRMRPLLPAARQLYRVYSEEEFLAVEDWSEPGEVEPLRAAIGECGPRPWGRTVVLAVLSLVAVAVTGVVAMNEARSRAGSGRRFASRRFVPRLPSQGLSTSPLTINRGASGGGSRRRLSSGRALATGRPIAERPTHASPPPAAHTFTRSQPHPSAVPPTPPAATATAATAAPNRTSASGAGSEFGFER